MMIPRFSIGLITRRTLRLAIAEPMILSWPLVELKHTPDMKPSDTSHHTDKGAKPAAAL